MVEISKIIDQNPWWKFGKEFKHYDKHLSELEKLPIVFERKEIELKEANIYAIHGPRQVGKTTEIKRKILKLIEKGFDPNAICYFSCEYLTSRKELRKVLDFFIDKLAEHEKIYIFLDEINFVKDWPLEIKAIADTKKFERICIVLTGSPLGLKIQTQELIGRKIEGNRYFLKPLSFRDFVIQISNVYDKLTRDPEMQNEIRKVSEILKNAKIDLEKPIKDYVQEIKKILPFNKSLKFLFEIYLKTGGFPAIIRDYVWKGAISKEYYERFVELVLKDVLKLGKSDRIVQQILSEIIKKFGTKFDFKDLSKEVGISLPTIHEYINLLEDIFLINVIYAFDFSKKSIKYKGSKKIYFCDPFIFHSINSWIFGKEGFEFSKEFLLNEENKSKIVENVVFNHLEKIKEEPIIKHSKSFLWFYYDRNKEIDFIFKRLNDFLAIEVKYKSKVSFEDVKKIKEVKEYLILSKEDFEYKENEIIVPVHLFLALLEKSEKNL